jgi:hypothetical protein
MQRRSARLLDRLDDRQDLSRVAIRDCLHGRHCHIAGFVELRDHREDDTRPKKASTDTTLSDLGISRDQSSRWLADMAEDQLEAARFF